VRIFSTDSPKAIKANAFGYINAIHYLAPFTLGGVGDMCPKASDGCRALCLGWFSGQASMVKDLEQDSNSVRASRVAKTRAFMRDREAYMSLVAREIDKLRAKASRDGRKLCVRMNGSSDIAWEGIRPKCFGGKNVFELFADVQFVDYTKIAARFARKLPGNYRLTFSRSEANEAECVPLLVRGVNVAVVFAGDKPDKWNGFVVIDGDRHDLRHLDPNGVVVGLTPKGRRAAKDTSGFVVR
jgi:hypothetical protein